MAVWTESISTKSPRGGGHQAGERWPSCGESTHSSGVAKSNPTKPGSSHRTAPSCDIPADVVGMGKSGKGVTKSAKYLVALCHRPVSPPIFQLPGCSGYSGCFQMFRMFPDVPDVPGCSGCSRMFPDVPAVSGCSRMFPDVPDVPGCSGRTPD